MYDFVFADNDGNGYIDENYRALGRLGESFVEINPDEMIPLPQGASLTMIPNRAAVVMNKKGQFTIYPHEGWVMGALLPQGYTRTLLPAFINDKKGAAFAVIRLCGGVRNGRRILCRGGGDR